LATIDWDLIFQTWRSSGGAALLPDKDVPSMVALLEFIAGDYDGSIEVFGKDCKRALLDDNITKVQVFEEAADQLNVHKKIWKVTQHMHPTWHSYEMPLVVDENKYIIYFKFQINDEIDGTVSPDDIKTVSLDYHINKHFFGVKHVKS